MSENILLERIDALLANKRYPTYELPRALLLEARAEIARLTAPEVRYDRRGKRGEVLYRGEGVGGRRIVLIRVYDKGATESAQLLQADEESYLALWHEAPPNDRAQPFQSSPQVRRGKNRAKWR